MVTAAACGGVLITVLVNGYVTEAGIKCEFFGDTDETKSSFFVTGVIVISWNLELLLYQMAP